MAVILIPSSGLSPGLGPLVRNVLAPRAEALNFAPYESIPLEGGSAVPFGKEMEN